MDEDGIKKHAAQMQKQKEALEKAKSLVQRPTAKSTSSAQPASEIKPPTFVTYPEFAPEKQCSVGTLLSLRRLLVVLYLAFGATATMYLISKVFFALDYVLIWQFLLQPLLQGVALARREYYQHASQKLGLLVTSLSG